MKNLEPKKKALLAAGALALGAAMFAERVRGEDLRRPDGRSMTEILGKDPELATPEDIGRLGYRDAMRLFHSARAPEMDHLVGEYRGIMPSGGPLAAAAAFMVDHVLPKGSFTPGTKWLGMGFKPGPANEGHGYGSFLYKKTGRVARGLEMLTFVSPTLIGHDMSDSFHLDYSPFNRGLLHGMHDEVRRVNDDLFICAGFHGLAGGPRYAVPFILAGPPQEWAGPDSKKD